MESTGLAGNLDRFRAILLRLREHLEQGSRPTRYKPPEELALLEIRLGNDPGEAQRVGEILDLSFEGMKVAITEGQGVHVGQTCSLRLGGAGGERYVLSGSVRWVESHPLITVFGIQLDGAEFDPSSGSGSIP